MLGRLFSLTTRDAARPGLPPANAVPAGLRRAWTVARDSVRIHGVWTPGVRLMRNLSIRAKALLLLVALVVVGVSVAADSIRVGHRAAAALEPTQAAVAPYASLLALERALDALRSSFAAAGAPAPASDLTGPRDAEGTAFAALARQIEPLAGADESLAVILQRVELRRTRVLGLLDRPTDQPRLLHELALDEYGTELHLLGQQLLGRAALEHVADETVQALINGGLRTLPDVALALERRSRLGAALPAGEFASTQLALELQRQALRKALQVEQGQAGLDRAVALGRLDGSHVERHKLVIREYLQRTLEVSAAALTSPEAAGDYALPTDSVRSLAVLAGRAAAAARELQTMTVAALQDRLAELREEARQALLRNLGMQLAALLLATYLLVSAYRVLAGGINTLCRNVQQLAAGNLGIRPVGHGRDEIGTALNEVSSAAARLTDLFDAVTDGVGAVGQASREVATGNGGLAGRTQEIRSSMSTVSERAESFSALMNRCSAEVEQTVHDVRAMQGEARRGRRSMGQLRERMGTLKVKSREITQMVRLMDAVAFQTRLLALNASVEAARSGAEGKGFSVVAQEVRALAQRNAEAARTIDDIVTSSLAEIEECSRLTERAVEAVGQTDLRIDAVNRSMGLIVSMTRDGMAASLDVASEARRTATSIEGNAKLVEQLSHASADLRQQGESLRGSVAQFALR